MKSLIVGSVFKNAAPDQVEWLDLQLQFLNATTEDYDHVVFMNDHEHGPFMNKTKVIGTGDGNIQVSQQHVAGLNGLAQYFWDHKDEYENFLFIDNDAFPIKRNWINILRERMDKHDKIIAGVLRPENLEQRLHASILFCTREALPLTFYFGSTGRDLLGYEEQDVGIGGSPDNMFLVFPLLRTNKINIHPISCGVYFDMFYHHAFGSPTTSSRFRAEIRDYSTHYAGNKTDFPDLRQRLMNDPWSFVRCLAGWNPEQYPGNPDLCKGGTGA